MPAARPIPVALGSRIGDGAQSGKIPSPGAKNVYTFSAPAGQQVYFRLLKQSNDMGLMGWRLEDQDGKKLFDAYFMTGDVGVKTLDRAGPTP